MYFAFVATLGGDQRADGLLVQSQNVKGDLLKNTFGHFLLLSFCCAVVLSRWVVLYGDFLNLQMIIVPII